MRLHVEIKRARRSMSTHFHVVGAALADGNALVRQIGNRQQPAIASLLNGVELDAELLDLLRSLTAGLLDLRGVDALPLRTRNFISRCVLFALQSLELGEDPPATRFERSQRFKLARQVHATFL